MRGAELCTRLSFLTVGDGEENLTQPGWKLPSVLALTRVNPGPACLHLSI